MLVVSPPATAESPAVRHAVASTSRFDHGLLWRVLPPADGRPSAPSHLFGTLHIDDPRAVDFSAPVRAALSASRTLLPELLPDAASARAFLEATTLAPGQTLAALAGDEAFERVADRLSSRYRVPREQANRLKPWAAYIYLSQPARPMGEIVDAALIRLAEQQGLPVRPLETVAQQIAAMEAVPMRSQLALLDALARDHDEAQASIERLVDRYLAQDLAGLRRLQDEAVQQDPSLRRPMADFVAQILDRRNERMLASMLPHLRAGGAFAAMGALHLAGEQGLLARLERLGWRVEPAD